MAVDELLDEHEQGERVREWVRQNAFGVFAGIGVALALVWGWGKWQDHLQAERIARGDAYAAINASIDSGDLDRARELAAGAGLDEGIYGTLVALDLAAAQVAAGEAEAAIETLTTARGGDPTLAAVVSRRLAVLLIDAGRTDEALATLGTADDASSLEIRGDAERAAGRNEQAREAYVSALAKLDAAAVTQRQLLEIKLVDVGGTPAQAEDDTP